MYAVNVLVYSIVFAGYAAMRIRKWVLTKNPDADSIFIKKVSVAVSVCAVLVCTVAFSMCFMRNGNKVSAQETAADKTLSQTQTEKGVKERRSRHNGNSFKCGRCDTGTADFGRIR